MTLTEFISQFGMTLLLGIIAPIIWLVLNSVFAKRNELDHEKRRITTLENKVDALPSQKDFSSLDKTITELAGDIKSMNAEMTHVKKNVDLLVANEIKRNKQ